MIVICGDLQPVAGRQRLAASIAGSAAHGGAVVQVVGIVPDGPEGDGYLLELAALGVGHAAVLRTRPRSLESADLELALRYLPDVRVVVAAGLEPGLIASVADGAAFAEANLVIVNSLSAEKPVDADLPTSAIVLEAPATDPDGTFAGFVAAFAGRLDSGEVPADAWEATLQTLAVDAITRDPDRRGPRHRDPAAAQ